MKNNKTKTKTIILCSNYAWTVYNFRLSLIRRLKYAGYRIVIVTQFDGYEEVLRAEVDYIYDLFISRKGVNPIVDSITFCHLLLIFYRSKADICLFFTIKPVIYGALAARLLSIPAIPMITGLGTGFLADNWITKVVKRLYRIALSSVPTVFFQNTNDKALFLDNRLVESSVCGVTPGSGIDLKKFSPSIPPCGDNITFLLIARMLRDKGIREFVEAATLVRSRLSDVNFQMLGPLGVENRSAISHEQIKLWQQQGVVSYLGETSDVTQYIKKANCIVLPSYREGTSRVLLEASAMARPIITTDVPGCREIVNEGKNGFLCRPKDAGHLAEKMVKMALMSVSDRQTMGEEGRLKVEKEYDQSIVSTMYIDAINHTLEKSI